VQTGSIRRRLQTRIHASNHKEVSGPLRLVIPGQKLAKFCQCRHCDQINIRFRSKSEYYDTRRLPDYQTLIPSKRRCNPNLSIQRHHVGVARATMVSCFMWLFYRAVRGGAHAAKKARLWLRLVVVGFSAALLVRILAPQIDAALTEQWTLFKAAYRMCALKRPQPHGYWDTLAARTAPGDRDGEARPISG
jgi:hypothetical protein